MTEDSNLSKGNPITIDDFLYFCKRLEETVIPKSGPYILHPKDYKIVMEHGGVEGHYRWLMQQLRPYYWNRLARTDNQIYYDRWI